MRKGQPEAKEPYLQQDVSVPPVPAPIKGWDAMSALANMDPSFAVTLDNWVPRTGWIELRKGFQAWVQGLFAGPVETLATYRPVGNPEKLLAMAGGSIFDVSDAGIPITLLTGLSNNRWQYLNFQPALGQSYLVLVNGIDPYTLYDGTTFTNPVVTGVSATSFITVTMFKRRLWFTQENSMSAWFLDTDAIQGPATEFPLGSLMSQGGFLMSIGTWTIDGGDGPDDFIAFISSRGQVAIYQGTDPTDANAFALVGVFRLPPPIGRRCAVGLGSDLYVVGQQGVLPLSQALPYDPSGVRSVAITSRIQNAMLNAATSFKNNFGWMMITYPSQSLFFLNVPLEENGNQMQFVQNQLTGAWFRILGWNANCFEVYNDDLYFGDNNGNVQHAWQGLADLVSPILADMKCAFNYFDDPGRIKRVTMVEPFLVTSGVIVPTISIDVDFGDSAPVAPVASILPGGAQFDFSTFDSSVFATGDQTITTFLSAEAIGRALAIRMQVNVAPSGPGGQSVFDTGVFDVAVFDGFAGVDGDLQVNAFNVVIEKGAPL